MKPYSQAWLETLNLSPLWYERGAATVGATENRLRVAPTLHVSTPADNLHPLTTEGGIYFVTFRLADSLPPSVLDELKHIPKETRSKVIEAHLDAGHGECLLSQPQIAQLLVHTLKTFDGERYTLHDWVVMPNHVHLVMEPRGEHCLSDILHSLKSYTTAEVNRTLERRGELWQHENYDRLLRDQNEFERCVHYVQQNPVKAQLVATPEDYLYGRAGFVERGKTAEKPLEITAVDLTVLDLPQLQQAVATCTLCPLHTHRTQAVFGVGDAQADVLFIGEAPGEEEDLQGEPFVGQAGKLLDNMLASIDLNRQQKVYITNVVKCRPPNNRDPEHGEASACAPYLDRQIDLIAPKLIVALGKVAATRLLGKESTIASLRGQVHHYQGRALIVTYHPAYLLRTLQDKAKAWEDLCFIQHTLQNLQNA